MFSFLKISSTTVLFLFYRSYSVCQREKEGGNVRCRGGGGGQLPAGKVCGGNRAGEHLKHKKINVKQKKPSRVSQPYYSANFTKAKVTKQVKVEALIDDTRLFVIKDQVDHYVPLKGTVSRDNLYSIFFIDYILLVLLEVIYEDFKFRRIFAMLFNQKGNSPV